MWKPPLRGGGVSRQAGAQDGVPNRRVLPDFEIITFNSGGAGRMRGGLGQIMEIAGQDDLEFACNAIFDRIGNPPRGRAGGQDGAAGSVGLAFGAKLQPKGLQLIPDGERLLLKLPGGGGMGDPAARDPLRVARDVRNAMVTREEARRV